MAQGDEADEVVLVLDGVVSVAVDGEALAELGPGAILGERALLEEGRRTSTVTATTPVKVAAVPGRALDRSALAELAGGHRREDAAG
jgi:CRP-like cAMP-binding protein